uniref:Hint domain-containing protein n=1 Tax=Parascaris univalens TaxID=6257 RepID=A0A915BXH3_PARUN
MSCTSAAILHKLGLIGGNKNYVDLRNEEMPSPVMVTAFSQDHWDEARRLISTIRRFWPEQLIIAYDLGVDEATARIVREQSNIQYREFKFHDYPSYMQRLLDFRWKPIVIAETLNEFGAIWYMDSSIVMRKGDLQHVYDLLRCKRNRTINQLLASTALRDKREAITANESDWDQMQWLENIRECRKSTYLLHGYTGHGIFAVTHSNTYIYIPTNFNEIKKPKAKMYEAGIAFAVRTAETMENIVKWYVLCALEEGCMGGNYSHSCHFSESGDRFGKYADCHRFDQSVVNLLLANTYYYDPHYYVSEIVDFFQVVRGVSMIEEALNLTRGQT